MCILHLNRLMVTIIFAIAASMAHGEENRTVTDTRIVPDSMRVPGRHIEIWDSQCITPPSGGIICADGENVTIVINDITLRTTPYGKFLMRGVAPDLFDSCRHVCEAECEDQGVASCIVHCARTDASRC